MDDPILPDQIPADVEPSRHHYKLTLESLRAMSDQELERVAVDSGVDGAQEMSRRSAHLQAHR